MNLEGVSVNLIVRFPAAAESIFDAWLDPEIMRRWLFANPVNRVEVRTIEPHVGGSFSIIEHAAEKPIDHFGTYIEIERPRRLRFTLQVPARFLGITLVTIDIAPTQEGCEMTFAQAGVKREMVEERWRKMFEALARLQL